MRKCDGRFTRLSSKGQTLRKWMIRVWRRIWCRASNQEVMKRRILCWCKYLTMCWCGCCWGCPRRRCRGMVNRFKKNGPGFHALDRFRLTYNRELTSCNCVQKQSYAFGQFDNSIVQLSTSSFNWFIPLINPLYCCLLCWFRFLRQGLDFIASRFVNNRRRVSRKLFGCLYVPCTRQSWVVMVF
jgi:hypothetical protein